MILTLTILGIALATLTFSIAYYKKDIIELLILGVTGFFCVYCVAGGALFAFNFFKFILALLMSDFIILIFLIIICFLVKRKPTVVFHIKEVFVPFVAFGLMLIVILPKNEFYGMGQDQGVYQVKALALMSNIKDNYYTFDEYDRLDNKRDIESYEYEAAKSLVGFYGYANDKKFLDKANYPSKMTGVFHGIPTYASMLALFSLIFGYENMVQLQTVFMFCGLFLMYYVMRNLKIKKNLRFAAMVVYASSPVVLWTAKTTLTEIFIFVLMMLYLYFMMDKNYPKYIWASAIPIVTFSFFHITIYTIMPMLVLAYITMFYMTRNKLYLFSNIAILIGYYLGFLMMINSSAVYSYGNYKKIFVLGINESNLIAVVSVVVAVCIAFTIALILVPVKKQEGFRSAVVGQIRRNMILVCRILLVLSILALIAIFMLSRIDFRYITIYAYMISSGFVVVAALFALFLYKPQFITAHKDNLLLTILFVYMIIMYSCIFKPIINSYYYYARYIVPYIPIILILAALRISAIKTKYEVNKSVIPVILSFVVLVIMLPFNFTLATQKDVSNMKWQILKDLSEEFVEKDAVIIDGELASTLKFPIKMLTGAEVYPITDNLREQIARLENEHDNVYYISTKKWFLFKNYSIDNIYSSENEIWMDNLQSDEGRLTIGNIPFAKNFIKTRQTVNVYKCKSDF